MIHLAGDPHQSIGPAGVQLRRRDPRLRHDALVADEHRCLERLRHPVDVPVVGHILDGGGIVLLGRPDAVQAEALLQRSDEPLVGEGAHDRAVHREKVGHLARRRLGGELLRIELGGVHAHLHRAHGPGGEVAAAPGHLVGGVETSGAEGSRQLSAEAARRRARGARLVLRRRIASDGQQCRRHDDPQNTSPTCHPTLLLCVCGRSPANRSHNPPDGRILLHPQG